MLLAPVPWAGPRIWALPFLTALCPSKRDHVEARPRRSATTSKRDHVEQGRSHKKLTDWARQMTIQLRRWLPGRKLVVVGDSSSAAIERLAAASEHVTMVTRLRLDAALDAAFYAPAPPRRPGQPGRPRKKGMRLPKLEAVLAAPSTEWQEVEATWWHGREAKRLDVATGTGVWYHPGMPAVPLRWVPLGWVLVRDPEGALDPKGFLCTDQATNPIDILRWFVRRWFVRRWFLRRWSVEVTFEEVRRHLGMETQRQWADLAIARTTPRLLGLFSLVTLMADRLEPRGELLVRGAA